jgi:hypothetical protein
MFHTISNMNTYQATGQNPGHSLDRLATAGITFRAKDGEEQWVARVRELRAHPPMPWFNVNRMSDEDLRAMYRFIRFLGPAGGPAPAYLPPNQEPAPPYNTQVQ